MAITQDPQTLDNQVQRLAQSQYVDAIRWVPSHSPFNRFYAVALHDSVTHSSSLQIHSLSSSSSPHSSWTPPSRITSLKTSLPHHKPFIATSTVTSSLHLLPLTASSDFSVDVLSLSEKGFHVGPISSIDVSEGVAVVSVGEDGRVNVTNVSEGVLSYRRVFDSNGLVSYTAAKWGSPSEFASGGLGFSLQWWDARKPGGSVSQFKGNWDQGTSSGIIHSVDIHPSRKHTCLAGGSSGTVFAWDLRWPQQPIVLSRACMSEVASLSPCESEVWEVQYDSYMPHYTGNIPSSQILPVMVCSEDGILAVVQKDVQSIELLAEPCAINSFDIDRQNPSDVICSLEWESIAFLSRP